MTTVGAGEIRRGYWARVAAVIVAAAAITSLIFGSLPSASVVTTVQHALAYSVALGALAAAIVPAVRRRVRDMALPLQWAATLAALFLVAVAGTALACAAFVTLGLSDERAVLTCVRDDLLVNALVTGSLGLAMALYEGQRARLDSATLELRTKELDRERASKMAVEARLASLESRLHPHFLFNTLNTISALIQEDPQQAERTVERLAALLRFSLDATGRGLVPLAEEMTIVAAYLEIEKARFGERLAYALAVSPEAAGWEVPPLAVQTLVENSVKHAIAPRPHGGLVQVTAGISGNTLRLVVRDDGPGFAPDAIPAGHGLDSLRERLAARFGVAALLAISRDGGATVVTLSLPRNGTPA